MSQVVGVPHYLVGEIMEKLLVPFEMKELTEDDDFYYFKGYASTFGNVDLGNDVVVEGAFTETITKFSKESPLPALWQHDHHEPVGVFDVLREDKKGLYIEGRMPKEDSFVRERVAPQMRIKSVKAMSIGFWIKDWKHEDDVRKLLKIDLIEISLVTSPMNPDAVITDFKSLSFDDIKEIDIRELEKQFKEGVKLSNKATKTIISAIKSLRDEGESNRDDWSEVMESLKSIKEA